MSIFAGLLAATLQSIMFLMLSDCELVCPLYETATAAVNPPAMGACSTQLWGLRDQVLPAAGCDRKFSETGS